jgi:hypothetical protein
MLMLTADGTRPSARAAAENEPWSSTARKIATLSDENAMLANLSEKLKAADFFNQKNFHTMQAVVTRKETSCKA